MKISYVTLVLKPKSSKNIDFQEFISSNFPKPSLYNSVILCSNQRCKESDIRNSSHSVIRFIKGTSNRSFVSSKKPVMCRIKGTHDSNNFEIRVSSNNTLKVSVGFSKTNYNYSQLSNTFIDNKISVFLKKYVLSLKSLPSYYKYDISNMTITSFKLFSKRIKSLKKLAEQLLPGISKYGYFISNTKNSSLRKIYFKNNSDNRFPTIGLFSNGTMDFNGVTKMSFVKKVIDSLKSRFKNIDNVFASAY